MTNEASKDTSKEPKSPEKASEGAEKNEEEKKVSRLDHVSKLATLIVTIIGIFSAFNTYQISNINSRMTETEFENKWNVKVYELVLQAVESRDIHRIKAVEAINEAMTTPELRTRFRQLLNDEKERLFVEEESLIAFNKPEEALEMTRKSLAEQNKSTVNDISILQGESNTLIKLWADWDIDIFWCESSGFAAQEQANALQKDIASRSKGRIRARMLPKSKNQSSGYQVSGVQIRPNKGEEEFADFVAKYILYWSNEQLKPTIVNSSQKTPWYLSVFICS